MIQIDYKIPESCYVCDLVRYNATDDIEYCPITNNDVSKYSYCTDKGRHPDCPLQPQATYLIDADELALYLEKIGEEYYDGTFLAGIRWCVTQMRYFAEQKGNGDVDR